MKQVIIIIFLCTISVAMQAQNATQADDLFQHRQYQEASNAYEALLKKQPKQALYLYRYARCQQELGNTEVAIEYFLQAGDKYPLRDFYLGELYFPQYQFAEAVEHYERYLETIEPSHERYEYTEQQIALAKKAERYMRRVEDIAIVDSVVLPKQQFLSAYRLSQEAGTLHKNGKAVVEFLNQRQDRRYLSTLPDTSASLTSDLITCQRLLDTWSECDTLPASVNSPANEAYPFMLADGITLYFASDREESLGGYDIYMTQYNSETNQWVKAENIGMPFNSFRNDYMMAIDEQNNIGYFATDRRCDDSLVVVYSFIPNNEKKVLRQQDETYIQLAAQLLKFRQPTEEKTDIVQTAEQQITPVADNHTSICFHLNDSITYTSLSDFHSYDARVLYQNYLQEKSAYESALNLLQQRRKDYHQAKQDNSETIQQISAEIITAEKTLEQQKKALKQQLNKVYSLEQKEN